MLYHKFASASVLLFMISVPLMDNFVAKVSSKPLIVALGVDHFVVLVEEIGFALWQAEVLQPLKLPLATSLVLQPNRIMP